MTMQKITLNLNREASVNGLLFDLEHQTNCARNGLTGMLHAQNTFKDYVSFEDGIDTVLRLFYHRLTGYRFNEAKDFIDEHDVDGGLKTIFNVLSDEFWTVTCLCRYLCASHRAYEEFKKHEGLTHVNTYYQSQNKDIKGVDWIEKQMKEMEQSSAEYERHFNILNDEIDRRMEELKKKGEETDEKLAELESKL